ncbi:ATP-binding protein [Phascolarctobacterium succinatutens]|jgi:predicted AAA+ superfamily ATPase|uniref:ATP-binding protein n=1 Tax=Phascolarctobacterium succinatutens TaxID=626940 RepID=UPI0027BAC0A6|nr:ATP-binding protein [Phascolarctobacterium succinatutens]
MLKQEAQLYQRRVYLNKLIAFQDTEPVKIITGIRRCGKSSLLKLMIKHLLEQGITHEQIIFVNFESMQFSNMSVRELYEYVKARLPQDKKAYLFFDEIQRIEQWQDAINSFRVDFACDIYVTGSNAYLLSGEYATYLAGRSVEIKMLPLSFAEFIEFQGYSIKEKKDITGVIRKKIYDNEGDLADAQELLALYMRFGGMPGLADINLNIDNALVLLDGVYSTVVVRDILERELRKEQRQITDSTLLRRLIMFLADNIGNSTSVTSISNMLVNQKLLENNTKKNKPAVQTLQTYISALLEAYVFYEIKRFDIKGKDYLRTLSKYYIVDIGLRNYLLGFRDVDTGHIIENIVYFELLRKGYDVAIGKIDDKEIDFIAVNAERKIYIQVTESMNDPATREREFAPLRKVKDNYEKIIIANEVLNTATQDGIRIVKLIDFLLAE